MHSSDIEEGLVARTVIDIDGVSLEAAAKALGAATTVATVHQALADVAGREQRLAVLHDLDDAAADLSDPVGMGAAWA